MDAAPTTDSPHLRVSDPAVSRVAKQAFFRIMDLWQVKEADAIVLLGSPSRGTYYKWRKGEGGRLSRDCLDRVSYVSGIYKALQIIFPDPAQADSWIRRPNDRFGGRSALEHMLGGSLIELADVRGYLDHVRGGGS